jgi:hypothetical protein
MSAHYLNVPVLPDGTRVEWEHKETAQHTGRSVRKLYQVPILLNPNDPADCNYPGELVVTHEVEGARIPRQDYIFTGDPTPEMEPLNEEAEAITARLRQKWDHPIDGLATSGNLNPQEDLFLKNMMAVFSGAIQQAQQPSVANTAIAPDDYNEMKERVAKLEAMIAAQAKPVVERRT